MARAATPTPEGGLCPDLESRRVEAARQTGKGQCPDELLERIQGAIESELSAHQRRVLVAVAVNGVPIDVMAERLNTTRGALYKTIHDARKKLRSSLNDAGFDLAGEEVKPG